MTDRLIDLVQYLSLQCGREICDELLITGFVTNIITNSCILD